MTTFEMYLFTRVDKLITVFSVSSVLSMIAFVFAFVLFVVARANWELCTERDMKMSKVALLFMTPIAALSVFCWSAIPTQKELAAILIVPKILSAENVDNLQKIGANGIDIVKLATDYTKEVLKTKEEEKK